LFIVCGLGNPGEEYIFTRHNVGFIIADRLSFVLKKKFQKKFNFLFFKTKNLIVTKPLTFMNDSGKAVKKMLKFFDVDIKDLLVVVDDFNIDLGTIRYRTRGSSGGHNGLNSIIEETGRSDFPRLRIGIGPVRNVSSDRDFVLSVFSEEELDKLKIVVKEAVDFILTYKNTGLLRESFTFKI